MRKHTIAGFYAFLMVMSAFILLFVYVIVVEGDPGRIWGWVAVSVFGSTVIGLATFYSRWQDERFSEQDKNQNPSGAPELS